VAEFFAGGLAAVAVASLGMALRRQRHDRAMAPLMPTSPAREAEASAAAPFPISSRLRPWLQLAACGAGWVIGSWLAGVPGAVAGASAGVVVPRTIARRARERRRDAIDDALADAVAAIASALRTGMSLLQALAQAGRETPDPLGPSLLAVADRATFGIPFDDAVSAWFEQVGTPDARLVAGVLQLHRRAGGASPAVLDRMARTLRARRTDAREVRSLTAQARLSAAILGSMPVGFFLFLSATSRSDMESAVRTPAGMIAIGLGLSLQVCAYLWIRRLLRVDR
jgi:tight adherence protein B